MLNKILKLKFTLSALIFLNLTAVIATDLSWVNELRQLLTLILSVVVGIQLVRRVSAFIKAQVKLVVFRWIAIVCAAPLLFLLPLMAFDASPFSFDDRPESPMDAAAVRETQIYVQSIAYGGVAGGSRAIIYQDRELTTDFYIRFKICEREYAITYKVVNDSTISCNDGNDGEMKEHSLPL